MTQEVLNRDSSKPAGEKWASITEIPLRPSDSWVLPLLQPYPLVPTEGANPGSKAVRGARMEVKKTGTLKDFAWFVAAASGNHIGMVFDVGAAASGKYTKLWDSGSVAVGEANKWQIPGSPNLAVNLGDHLLFLLVFDNGTAKYGKTAGAIQNAGVQLPSAAFDIASKGITYKGAVGWALSEFAAPATVEDATATVQTAAPVFMARVE